MQMSRRGSGPVTPAFPASLERVFGDRSLRHGRVRRLPRYLAGTLMAASVCLSAAQAANFGHSRIVSALGEPLHLEIQVTQLTPQEVDTLRATPAPAEAWHDAGMTPPVPLQSMRLLLLDGYRPDVKVIQLRSDRRFDEAIVDVLLDVRSVSGQQRYQVSLVAQADTQSIQRASSDAGRNLRAIDGLGLPEQASTHPAAGRQITVSAGDNMFAIARRNAVQGVTVYQMMMALQRSNPHAFIEDNVNLVKAGASLTMPDMDVLTALSDREARRIFQQHAQAFALYRQRGGASDVALASTVLEAGEGAVETVPMLGPSESEAGVTPAGVGDRLRLSGGASPATDAGTVNRSEGSALGTPASSDTGRSSESPVNSTASSTNFHGVSRVNGLNGLNGGAATAASTPPVSLLASSGAIASDAVVHEAPDALSSDTARSAVFGSDASSGGTVITAGSIDVDPDDEAARKKRIEESKKRILELEDNVRHLNEALQKQGHVAAEAALEGARSVTEVIKEVMSLVDPDENVEEAGTSEASGGDANTNGNAADERPSAEGKGTTAVGADGTDAGLPAGASTASASRGANALPSGRVASSAAGTGPSVSDTSATSSPTVAQEASWLRKNMLPIVGGGLALLVLVVVWLLRRASAAGDDEFERANPITDSMVQQKLREIDLDLDQPPTSGRRSS